MLGELGLDGITHDRILDRLPVTPQPLGPIKIVVLPLGKLNENSLSAKEESKDLEIFFSEIDTIVVTTSQIL